ncbi:uncharacterized protein LOC142578296 [Dermacentor variabilis]|uniref:uncharacterized protein LOC142578296 n=1 Tax=Dermacentor variabilis TaxID=34621 RepID=UPI003F5C3B9C
MSQLHRQRYKVDREEGGFAVLPLGDFNAKATVAIDSVFKRDDSVSLANVKLKAKKLCKSLSLDKLAKVIEKTKKLSLDIFFSAKTHKNDCPLRVIVTEAATWQKAVGLFLQDKLNLLTIDDPFLVRHSGEVISFLKENEKGLKMFSIDVKDLYYSLPHDKLLLVVEECIDDFEAVGFQNAAGVSVSGFLELLTFYLKSTYISWNEQNFIQKKGVCIGSCLAPVLSDIYLAHHDRIIHGHLAASPVVKVCRFVDDYLIFIDCTQPAFEPAVSEVLDFFKKELEPLELTHEVPIDDSLRFLDLRLSLANKHVCWCFEPRSKKPLLPFNSAHSKLVKRGIIKLCFPSSLMGLAA